MTRKIKSATPRLFRIALGVSILALFAGAPMYAHPVPSPCFDFVTGGGWFTPTPQGSDRANFGFNAGYRTEGGELKGHLNYIDHNTGMHVKGTNVDTYGAFGCEGYNGTCADRYFEGDAVIDGVAGFRYHAEVVDDGEPGNRPKGDDRFILSLSNGYYADSGGAPSASPCTGDVCGIDGGNIQIHKPCNGISPK